MHKIFGCNLKIFQYTIVCYLLYIYKYTWGYLTTIWNAIIQHPMDFLTSRLFFKTGVFWRDFCSRSTGWIDGRQPVSDHPAVEVVGGKLYGCVDHFVGGCFFFGREGRWFSLVASGSQEKNVDDAVSDPSFFLQLFGRIAWCLLPLFGLDLAAVSSVNDGLGAA